MTLGMAGAFVAGLISFLSPCVLPLVPAYISYVAGQPAALEARGIDARARAATLSGFFVLAFYAAGLGVPFVATALFMSELAGRLKSLRRAGRVLQLVAGAILVAMGIAMMTGQLNAFGFWLLRTFPALGRIG